MKIQFSIRDLLMMVAIVALAAGWWIDHQRISRLVAQQSQPWEYKIYTAFGQLELFGSFLNNFGNEDWEACAISEIGSTSGERQVTVLFKRPKR